MRPLPTQIIAPQQVSLGKKSRVDDRPLGRQVAAPHVVPPWVQIGRVGQLHKVRESLKVLRRVMSDRQKRAQLGLNRQGSLLENLPARGAVKQAIAAT
jgi:hypothetical protein